MRKNTGNWFTPSSLEDNLNSKNALHLASSNGDIEGVKVLLAAGADINAKDKDGMRALHLASDNLQVAVVKEYVAVVKVLLAAGADINAKDEYGRTALMIAANRRASDNEENLVVSELLAAEADINARDNGGMTALMIAAGTGAVGVVKKLLAAGAGIHAQDDEYDAALYYASCKNHADIMALLQDNVRAAPSANPSFWNAHNLKRKIESSVETNSAETGLVTKVARRK